jgi:hypothetical protein
MHHPHTSFWAGGILVIWRVCVLYLVDGMHPQLLTDQTYVLWHVRVLCLIACNVLYLL